MDHYLFMYDTELMVESVRIQKPHSHCDDNDKICIDCDDIMKWILFPIVMATTADKMGFIGAGEDVHVAATIEFFTTGISVRLSDRSLHREQQKKIVKNCSQWGLKPVVNIQLSAWIFMAFIKSCSIGSGNEQSPTCEVVHEIIWQKRPSWKTQMSQKNTG